MPFLPAGLYHSSLWCLSHAPLWQVCSLMVLPSKRSHVLQLLIHSVLLTRCLSPFSLIPSTLFIPRLFVCAQATNLPENPYQTVLGTAWQSCEPGLESVKSEGKGWRREARASFAKAVIASVVLTSGLAGCCLGWCVIKLIALTSCDAITP